MFMEWDRKFFTTIVGFFLLRLVGFAVGQPPAESKTFDQNTHSNADEGAWQSFGEALISDGAMDALKRLASGKIRVDEDSAPKTYFEFFNMKDDKQGGLDSYYRMLTGVNNSVPFLVYLDEYQRPTWIGIGDHLYLLSSDGAWKETQVAWKLILDAVGPSNSFSLGTKDSKSEVILKASSYFSNLENEAKIKWQPAEMAIEVSEESRILRVFLNSPSDQIVHGYPFSGFRFYGKKQASILRIRAISTHPQLVPNLHFDSSKIPADLTITPSPEIKLSVPLIQGEVLIASSLKFWSFVSGSPLLRGDEINLDPAAFPALPLRERAYLLIGLLAQHKDAENLDAETEHSVAIVRDLLETATRENSACPLPDDSSLRWRLLESELGEMDLRYFAGEMANIAAHPTTPIGEAALLTRLQIMLGESPLNAPEAWRYPLNRTGLDEERQRQFHGIRNACWGYGAEEQTIKLCQKLFRDHKPGTAPCNLAADVFIRLDKAEDIPQEVMREWFAVGAIRSGPVMRSYHLSALTLTPSGRAFLLNWWRKTLLHDTLWKECAKVLQSRVDATLKTKRLDFMSRDECERIQEVLRSLE